VLGESWDSQWECSSVSAMSVSAVSCLGSQRKRRIYWLTSVSDLLSWGQWLYFLCIYCIIMIWCKLNFIIFTLILSCSSNVCWTLFCCVPWHLVTALYTVIQKKGCHPNHGYNFVNSWSICRILLLLQRAVNFQQNHVTLLTYGPAKNM